MAEPVETWKASCSLAVGTALARRGRARIVIGNEIQGHRMGKHYEDTHMER